MVVSGRLILLDSKSYSDNKPVFSLSLVVIHFSDNQWQPISPLIVRKKNWKSASLVSSDNHDNENCTYFFSEDILLYPHENPIRQGEISRRADVFLKRRGV